MADLSMNFLATSVALRANFFVRREDFSFGA
jgi:hypothetical protein